MALGGVGCTGASGAAGGVGSEWGTGGDRYAGSFEGYVWGSGQWGFSGEGSDREVKPDLSCKVFQACLGSIDAFASGGGLIDMVSNQVGRVFMVGFRTLVGFLLQVKSDEGG